MPAVIPPLDEQEYVDPQMPLAHLDSDNNAIFYLMNSPFFDGASNNSAVYSTAQGHPNGMQLLNDRPTYEAELRKYNAGLQYIVGSEPKAEGQPWLIQRQRKVLNRDGNQETVNEGNFYTQGTRLLMAPSLLDVVQARLLTVSTRLQQISELSKSLSHWSPATGHTYLPPSYISKPEPSSSSRISSPVLGPTDTDPASQTQPKDASQQSSTTATTLDPTTDFNDAFFLHSLHLTHAYGDEHTDLNPLLGEPGSFIFTNSRSHMDALSKAEASASQSQTQTQNQTHPSVLKLDTSLAATTPTPRSAATPKGAATPLEAPSRKGSVAGLSLSMSREEKEREREKEREKRKRRKSRGLGSPVTPGGA